MPASGSRLTFGLSTATTALAAGAAAAGLLAPGVYREAASGADVFSKAYWFGNDLVTLAVAVPAALLAARLAARGSHRARLVWLGTVYYFLYNFSFYLFGASLNWFFPLYLGCCLLATVVLARGYGRGEAVAVPEPGRSRDGGRWVIRLVGGYMVLIAMIVVATWTAGWVESVSAGESGTAEGEFIRTVAALDIPLLATGMLLGAGWLWRGRPLGWAVATMMNVSTAGYMLVLAAAAIMNARDGVAGAAGESVTWAALCAGCLAASVALVRRAPTPGGEA